MTAFDSVLEDLAKKKDKATQDYNRVQAAIEAKKNIYAEAFEQLATMGVSSIEDANKKAEQMRVAVAAKIKEVEELLK